MNISDKLDQLHLKARENRWFSYFAILGRIALAAGFIPSGMVKILGERFTALSNNHPMGSYLEAFYHTSYYYTFVGVMQVTAGLLLLIPRTATLGAFLYFPIILNICILSIAVRFDGSLLSSPLMVLANLYLLCWDYHKWKFILPFNKIPVQKSINNKFPTAFVAGSIATIVIVLAVLINVHELRPHNDVDDCQQQCEDSNNPVACLEFCECIHLEGQPLDNCLNMYYSTPVVE